MLFRKSSAEVKFNIQGHLAWSRQTEKKSVQRAPPKPKATHTSGQEKISVTARLSPNTPYSKDYVFQSHISLCHNDKNPSAVCVVLKYNIQQLQQFSKFIAQPTCINAFSPLSLKSSGWRIRWSSEMTQSFGRSPIRAFARWRFGNLAASMVACTPAEPRTPRERLPSPAS